MKIEYIDTPLSGRHRLDSLSSGQCVVFDGKVFVRPRSLWGGRPQYDGKAVEAIATDGSDLYTDGGVTFSEVYEIESITLRRVK